jgi:NAD(P)-dependent dehydrogenase (short-subunit alcohol dehydrogenase family)
MAGRLDGRIALGLGCTAGDGYSSIGAAMAHFLRDEGALVLPASRHDAKVSKTLTSLNQTVPKLDVARLTFDARDYNALGHCVAWIEDEIGSIDILINSQGIGRKKPTIEMTQDDWHEVYGINLTTVSIACQTVGQRMLERKRGHIVNIASETSLQAFPYVAAYGASKGGVRALTAHLATEWARFGLCVNALAPGLFLTALNRPIMQQDPQRLEKILQATPALRLGDDRFEDLRAATVFLTTCSNYVNGQLIAVDGGMSIAAFT